MEKWSTKKFETIEEKINYFIESFNTDYDNFSQLINDFEDYYFTSKPIIPNDLLKRLFYGYLKMEGIFDHLKICHIEIKSIKTRTLLLFFQRLLDNNKSF